MIIIYTIYDYKYLCNKCNNKNNRKERRRRKKNPFFSVTSFFPIDLSFDLVLTSKEKKNGDVEGFVKVNLNETKDVEAILNVR